MLTGLLMAIAAQAAPAPPAAPQVVPPGDAMARMAALYEKICLTPFPDDAAVDTAMAALPGTTPLTPDQVKIYLHDDPGRGWAVADPAGRFTVTIEAPPYHACGVRHEFAAAVTDRSAYQAVRARYQAIGPAFQQMGSLDLQHGSIKSHLEGEGRTTAFGNEILMVVTDTRPDGSIDMRFVRQIKK